MSFAGSEILPAENAGGTGVSLEESFESGSEPTNWVSHPSGIGYRRNSPGITTWTGSGSGSTSSTGTPFLGNAPTMDSGMSDGGSGDELTRLLTFLTGGNENPSSTQPGPTSRAEQTAMPFSPNGSPAVTNLLLTDPDADLPVDAAPFSPSNNGGGAVVGIGFDGGGSRPNAGITNLLNTDPDASVSVDASPFDPSTDGDFGVTAISAMSTQMSGRGSIVPNPGNPQGTVGSKAIPLGTMAGEILSFFGTMVLDKLLDTVQGPARPQKLIDQAQMLLQTAQDMATVWGNTSDMSTPERVSAVVGVLVHTQVGLRQLGDYAEGTDAVDGHIQSHAENARDFIDGSARLGSTIAAAIWSVVGRLFGGGCFAAGTPILTPDGSKLVENIRPGDWVIAAPDDDPEAEPVPRQVEEVFENYLPLLDLYVNGRTIRTTAEHPFWVRERGWVAAHQLQAGDQLRTHDGRWLKVDGFEGPKPSEPVYNMCVSGYHTYFVGHQTWGFAIWSHNIGLCRHHTDGKGLDGIRKENAIRPSRGTPNGVDVEVEPFGPARPLQPGRGPKARTGAAAEGAYVEFDLPEGAVSTAPETGSNTARIPTDTPLSLDGLNPKFVKVPWWKFWAWW
jgi:hypothetical protein